VKNVYLLFIKYKLAYYLVKFILKFLRATAATASAARKTLVQEA